MLGASTKLRGFLRLLGYRDRSYRGTDFTVRIEPILREEIRVIFETHAKTWDFGGVYIGKRWQGINVVIPVEIDPLQADAIAARLTEALAAMGYGYVISRALEVETVPQSERENAISELHKMGYEIEILENGSIRQTKMPESPKVSIEELRKQTPRMMKLIEAVHGKRRHSVTLAKSDGF